MEKDDDVQGIYFSNRFDGTTAQPPATTSLMASRKSHGSYLIIDDKDPATLKLAKESLATTLYIKRLDSIINKVVDSQDIPWIYDPSKMSTIFRVFLGGPVGSKWIENSLRHFSNLTKLHVLGEALIAPLFARKPKKVLTFPSLKVLTINVDNKVLPKFLDESASSSLRNTTSRFSTSIMKSLRLLNSKVGIWTASTDQKKIVSLNIQSLLNVVYSPILKTFSMPMAATELVQVIRSYWKSDVVQSFVHRHVLSLEDVILHEWANTRSISRLQVPQELRCVFLTLTKDTSRSHDFDESNFASRLLMGQQRLQRLHCTTHCEAEWILLLKSVLANFQYLQVVNLGCQWGDLNEEDTLDFEIFSSCSCLKMLTLTLMPETGAEGAVCKAENLESLRDCSLLEYVFISFVLCNFKELEVFLRLPNLRTLVLVFVGDRLDCGVTLGVLEDYLRIRTLDTVVVTQFLRQKHTWKYHRLKDIIASDINTPFCPVISRMFPTTGFGKYVYIGELKDN